MKKIFTLTFVLFLFINIKAQIKTSIGASIFYGVSNKYVDGNGSKGTIELYGPTFWVKKFLNEESKITVGIPLSVMLSGSVGSQTGSSLSYGVDLPLTVEYNFGLGSSAIEEESDQKIGGFIGGGFGYTYSSNANNWSIPDVIVVNETVKGASYGPLAHLGVRFIVKDRPITLRAQYKMGLEKAKFNTFGGSLFYSF